MLLRKMLQWARIIGPETTSDEFPVQNVEYMGKTAPSFVFYPYGYHARAPSGFLCLKMAMNGNAENRVSMPCSPQERPTLKEGEVAFYHPQIAGLIITLKNDQTVEVKSPVKLTVDAPDADFLGNVKVFGNLEVVGDTALSGTVTSNGVDISDTHVHSGVTSGGSNTGTPV